MTDDDRPAFAQAMSVLAITFGTDLTRERIEAYWHALRDVDMARVRCGVERCMRESTFFPVPAEIRRSGGGVYVPGAGALIPDGPPIDMQPTPRRPALEAPVAMQDTLAAVIASVEAAVEGRKAADEAARQQTPDEVLARKAALREQAKRLLLEEPEGES